MRIQLFIREALRAKFSSHQINVWTTTWEKQPHSVSSLAANLRLSPKWVLALIKTMAEVGWMASIRDGNKMRPIAIIPHDLQQQMVQQLHNEYAASPLKHEFVMKKILDLLILAEDYIDNARLEFLKNTTGHFLELDRYYPANIEAGVGTGVSPAGVGWECNEIHHLGPTERAPDLKAAKELQTRDTRKFWLCNKARVKLIRVYITDLHPNVISSLIPDCLPRAYSDQDGPYFKSLCDLCARHIKHYTEVDIQMIMNGNPLR